MDGRRFDDVAKAWGAAPSRRGLLRTLIGGTCGSLLAGLGPGAALAACAPHGAHCVGDARCCSGFCRRRGKCVEDGQPTGTCRCRCPRGTTSCGDAACCTPGQGCRHGRCVDQCTPEDQATACGPDQACRAGACVCTSPRANPDPCGGTCCRRSETCAKGACRCAVPCQDVCCPAGQACITHPNGQGVCCPSGRVCQALEGYTDCCLDDPDCVDGGCCPPAVSDGQGNCVCPPGMTEFHDEQDRGCLPCLPPRTCYAHGADHFCCPEGGMCLPGVDGISSGGPCCTSAGYCDAGGGGYRCCGEDEADCVQDACCPESVTPDGSCVNPNY
jgi:hypothetical protein